MVAEAVCETPESACVVSCIDVVRSVVWIAVDVVCARVPSLDASDK